MHCIDHQTVDVGDAAFSVPPQQLITHDGGIIEIGAEVQMVMDMIIIDLIMIMKMTKMTEEC